MAHPRDHTLSVLQTTCLSEAVYFESRGEGTTGMNAVAYVILNRTRLKHKTICEVIHQRGQFSFYNLHRRLEVRDLDAWRKSVRVSIDTQIGIAPNPIGDAIYYNTRPMYIRNTRFVRKINHQYFYRTYHRYRQ